VGELLVREITYRAAVAFLAGFGIALIFRVSRTFDIAAASMVLLAMYISERWFGALTSAALLLSSASAIWWFVYRPCKRSALHVLAASIGLQIIVQSCTTLFFGDSLLTKKTFGSPFGSGTLGCGVILVVLVTLTLIFRIVWNRPWTTLHLRTVMQDPELAACIGVRVEVMQVATFTLGVAAMLASALLWQSETQIKAANAASLLIYGIAVGAWGRELAPHWMLAASYAFAFIATFLSYYGGPLLADVAYLAGVSLILALPQKRYSVVEE
jgi:branched-subunit amino acid ABC-type transport system permease component